MTVAGGGGLKIKSPKIACDLILNFLINVQYSLFQNTFIVTKLHLLTFYSLRISKHHLAKPSCCVLIKAHGNGFR